MYWEELLKEYTVYQTNYDKSRSEVRILPSQEYVIERLKERKAMQLYTDRLAAVEDMTDEEAGKYIKSLYAFATRFEEPSFNGTDRFMANIYRSCITERIILDRKYIKQCIQNRLNKTSPEEVVQAVTSGYGSLPMVTDTDTDTDTGTGTDTDTGKGRGMGSKPSVTLREFGNYCKRKYKLTEEQINFLYREYLLQDSDMETFVDGHHDMV